MKTLQLFIMLLTTLILVVTATAAPVVKPHTFIANTPAKASEVNDNFDTIYTKVNSQLDLAGGTMSGKVNMGGNALTNVAPPTLTTDAATVEYVDQQIAAATASGGTTVQEFFGISQCPAAWTQVSVGYTMTSISNTSTNNVSPQLFCYPNASEIAKVGAGTASTSVQTCNASGNCYVGITNTNLFIKSAATADPSSFYPCVVCYK